MKWIPGTVFPLKRASFVMNMSLRALAAQASWIASGGFRERSFRRAA